MLRMRSSSTQGGAISASIILFTTFATGTCFGFENAQKNSLQAQILRQPAWVKERSWGLRKQEFPNIKAKDWKVKADHEPEIAWTHFFNGTTNGLVLELGAMDGKYKSVSRFFEHKVGWKSILIEGSSEARDIPKNRPNALSLHLAVCEKETTVHFVSNRATGGILEFMSPRFLQSFHSHLLKEKADRPVSGQRAADVLDWEKVRASPKVKVQACLPLQAVFDHFQIRHINFMVLDLEGGELSALKSLDFERIEFDVLCVETNRFRNKGDPYISQVVNYLTGKGYKVFRRTSGRNSWFVSSNWTQPALSGSMN